MQNRFSPNRVQQFGKVFPPVLAIAVLSVLIAGCSQTTTPTDTTGMSSSLPMQDETSSTMMDSQSMMSVPSSTSSAPDSMMGSSMSDSAMVPSKQYKDGTYSATGNYRSPAGAEMVDVTLTLKSGIVTDATFTGEAKGGRSQQMQSAFASGFKEDVVGKSIDSISLSVVNGSSLTPQGFMDAVQKIETEAAAA
jgi:uncharacterized protein with FMN-binding domain